MSKPTKFHVRVNDGREETITVRTTLYTVAVAAVPALLGCELPATVEIWVPRLLPQYGPYFYRVEFDEYRRVVTNHLVVVSREAA